jgi:hypothetical protein
MRSGERRVCRESIFASFFNHWVFTTRTLEYRMSLKEVNPALKLS